MSISEKELQADINKIINLLALIAVKDKPQKDQIGILSQAGFQPKEIADIINTTSNTVSVILHKLKSRKQKIRMKQNDRQDIVKSN
ncbi:MAG: hypothetical protein ACHQQQ_15240 [Bacteroidota bacterium]